jgi:aryl-alcohol dehydrogenase-like predicted oxidoreductase
MSGVLRRDRLGAAIDTIHRALDLGVTFIDTADTYGAGHSEVLVVVGAQF